MITVVQQPHWRAGEEPIRWVEDVCATPKVWGLLSSLPPSSRYVDGLEAQIHLVTLDRSLRRREPLWLRAHREEGHVIIVSLFAEGGRQTLRRGHIGGGHQEPDGGPFAAGPHVHFPTSVFREIENQGRSRTYPWPISPSVSLRQAVLSFAHDMNVRDDPEERPLLLGEF